MSFLRRSPTAGHGAPAAKPVAAEELGAPETFGTFDAPASVEADAECVGEGLAPASLEGLALNGVQPPTISTRATNTAPTRLVIKTEHYTGQRVMAEREGFEPSMGLPPNRISNPPPRRDRRASWVLLRSGAGVLRTLEGLEGIRGPTGSPTQTSAQ